VKKHKWHDNLKATGVFFIPTHSYSWHNVFDLSFKYKQAVETVEC